MRIQSLGWEDPLEEEMATHSGVFVWKILWTEKPGRLQSMGPQRARHVTFPFESFIKANKTKLLLVHHMEGDPEQERGTM